MGAASLDTCRLHKGLGRSWKRAKWMSFFWGGGGRLEFERRAMPMPPVHFALVSLEIGSYKLFAQAGLQP
jgi:hypothetical protein